MTIEISKNDIAMLERECSRSRCVGGCVCADTWGEVNRLRDVRDHLELQAEAIRAAAIVANELEEWNEIAQWCHNSEDAWFRSPGPDIAANRLAKLLDDYARLRVEVEQLRAQVAEFSDDTHALQRETD